MICSNCGAPLDENAQFCTNCGAAVSPYGPRQQAGAPKKNPLKWIVGGLLAVLLLALGFFAGKGFSFPFLPSDAPAVQAETTEAPEADLPGDLPVLSEEGKNALRYEGPGFDTPEEAVLCYVYGLKNLDYEQMLSAFAWETQAEHYSVKLAIERLHSYSPSYHPRMPSSHAFLVEANLQCIRAWEIDLIYRSLETYLLGDAYPDGKTIVLKTEEEIDAFLQQYDLGRLKQLSEMSNIRFVSPDALTEGRFSSEQNQRNMQLQSAQFCADEVVNLVVLADVGDEIFYAAPTVVRYGEKWYLASVGSNVSSMLGVSSNIQAFYCAPKEDFSLLD